MRSSLLKRFLIGVIAGIIIAIPFSEFAFRWQGNTTSRPPRTIKLDIPAGTAQKVGQGQSVLPADLTFVAGDILLVENHDSVIHTLGPLVIPAGSSATLTLANIGNLSYTCSFQPTKYQGMDILEPLSLGTRLEGILISGIPMGMLISLYSLIVRPLKKSV